MPMQKLIQLFKPQVWNKNPATNFIHILMVRRHWSDIIHFQYTSTQNPVILNINI